MKITAIRIRILRSRPTGYGHDAAEIEAQLEDGDDPEEVAADLRRRCEAEVRQGAEQSRLLDNLDSLQSKVSGAEQTLARLRAEAGQARDLIQSFENFIEAAATKGVHVPSALRTLTIPF